jgi:hypothetical protein
MSETRLRRLHVVPPGDDIPVAGLNLLAVSRAFIVLRVPPRLL